MFMRYSEKVSKYPRATKTVVLDLLLTAYSPWLVWKRWENLLPEVHLFLGFDKTIQTNPEL